MNYDFCPWANRYVYWLKQPIGWVACAIVSSLLVGLTIGPQGFILMWAFTGLLALGAAWPWLSIKGISCQLSFAKSRSVEGEDTIAVLDITNHWPVPIFGLMIVGDFLQDLVTEDDKIAMGLQRIPGGSVSSFKWNINPEKRGLLPTKDPKITNGFPFGIYHAVKEVTIRGKTIVWPKSINLKGVPEVTGTQFNISGIMSDRAGVDGDMIGVRNYRQGDSLRHIHWGKTAQKDRLIVQERQSCASRPFEVFVDLAPSSHCGMGSQSSYEWTIRVAGSICRQLHLHHAEVVLVCLGLPADVESKVSNQNGLNRLMDFLAMLPALPDLAELETYKPSRSFTPDRNQKTFLICTTKSQAFPDNGQQHTIVLDAHRFQSGTPLFKEEMATSESTNVTFSTDTLQVTDPLAVEKELGFGWEHGVSNGS
ncbi:MAG: DUF58 domain-containing protein [Mariniblastus sp.]|nr:DUF58 domain-containing protein [Mariniblastus sp.]